MTKNSIWALVVFLLIQQPAYAASNRIQIRGCNNTRSVYSGNRNKVQIQLSNRAYNGIKSAGIKNIELKLNHSKNTESIKIDLLSTNAYLRKRTLVFLLPNDLLKHKGLYNLSIITSNQVFNGSFNYVPNFEITNNVPGLEISVLPQEQPLPANEIGEGLVIESITEEPAQNISSENGLEISF